MKPPVSYHVFIRWLTTDSQKTVNGDPNVITPSLTSTFNDVAAAVADAVGLAEQEAASRVNQGWYPVGAVAYQVVTVELRETAATPLQRFTGTRTD